MTEEQLREKMELLGFRYEPSEGGYFIHSYVDNPENHASLNSLLTIKVASMIIHQLELAKIEAKIDEVNNMPAIYEQYAIPRLFELQSELNKQKDLLTKESK